MRRRRLAWLRVPKIAFFIFLAASCTHGAETQSDADVIDTALFSHDDAAAANAKAVTKATLADTLAAGVAQAKANAAAQDVSHRLVRADESSSESATGSQTWQPEMGQITCCNGGTPTVPENIVRNFTIIPSDYTIEERTPDDTTMSCRDFEVRYLVRRNRILNDDTIEEEVPLKCRCYEEAVKLAAAAGAALAHSPPKPPDEVAKAVAAMLAASRKVGLDANCRRLPGCQNGGYRVASSAFSAQCVCPQPYFGDYCQHECVQGQRLRGHNGRDYCSCVPFYQGDECRDLLCLNGGREENARCTCLPQFLGTHCEINTNHSGVGGTRFQRFGDQSNDMLTRDVSGTIFSLVMIIVLVVSLYLLLRHKLQTRYLQRRPDLLGACSFPTSMSGMTSGAPNAAGCFASAAARRGDLISPDDPRLYSFRPVSSAHLDVGPPPYFQQRSRRGRDILPPLPSYEDATKLPPLRHNIGNDEADDDEAVEVSSHAARSHSASQALSTATVDASATATVASETASLSSAASPGETVVASIRGNEMVRRAATPSFSAADRASSVSSDAAAPPPSSVAPADPTAAAVVTAVVDKEDVATSDDSESRSSESSETSKTSKPSTR